MKKISTLVFCLTATAVSIYGTVREGFNVQANTAQYKGSDYSGVVHVEHGITLDEAFDIAQNNPDVAYFFYVKGRQMVLEMPEDARADALSDPFGLITYQRYITDTGVRSVGHCRIFKHGDAIFFKKEGIWLGTAPGLADTFIKE